MNPTERTRLMHAVLDGEATPEETRELERLLAADPAARAEYDELRSCSTRSPACPRPFPRKGSSLR